MMKRGMPLSGIHADIESLGLDAALATATTDAEKRRLEAASTALLEDFTTTTHVLWSHSAFCQVGLPYRRQPDGDIWHRHQGRTHLVVQPGTVIDHGDVRLIGVPYGPKSRLMMLYIHSHVRPDGTVPMGKSLSGWMARLGIDCTGGKNGSLALVKEQVHRLSRCQISIHFTDQTDSSRIIQDRSISGVRIWGDADPLSDWHDTLVVCQSYVEHLIEHRVPIFDGAISHLKGSCLGLDLYAFLSYRLVRLTKPLHLYWPMLAAQLGTTAKQHRQFKAEVLKVLPEVLAVYPEAKVEVSASALILKPSLPPVPGRVVHALLSTPRQES